MSGIHATFMTKMNYWNNDSNEKMSTVKTQNLEIMNLMWMEVYFRFGQMFLFISEIGEKSNS